MAANKLATSLIKNQNYTQNNIKQLMAQAMPKSKQISLS
jgi:hypothetical protein